MPEMTLSERRAWGIEQVNAFLSEECGASRLSNAEVQRLPRSDIVAGWRFTAQPFLEPRQLIVCLDTGYPFSNPQFLLEAGPPFLTWPHVEPDGKLCLTREVFPTDASQPAQAMRELLCEAFGLLKKLENGSLANDFRSEFLSYWNRTVPDASSPIYSLIVPRGPSRIVRIGACAGGFVAAETEGEIKRWCENLEGSRDQAQQTKEACLLWLQEPLMPPEYPARAQDIWKMAESIGATSLLPQLVTSDKRPVVVLFGSDTENGTCFGGARISETMDRTVRDRRIDRTRAGFPPNRMPEELLTRRFFFSPGNFARVRVDRADASWIHGRDHDPSQSPLRSSRVAVVGCGAIGAAVGVQLAMSGVGCLRFVDPETLSWSNVGRHALGASSVRRGKAEELANMLATRFPHSRFEYRKSGFSELSETEPCFLEDCDLMVCATGIWNVESALNNWQFSKGSPKHVVYAWAEPHACAGHAVAIVFNNACLQCQFSARGDSKLNITEWAKEVERQEPACGAFFQPFGPIEISWITALASSLALDCLLGKIQQSTHRIWAGPKVLLAAARGNWNSGWIAAKPNRESGGFLEEFVWSKDANCLVCR